LVLLACVLALPVGAAHAEYRVGLTHGLVKQRPEFDFQSLAEVRLRAARNEWEPFQVLIRDDAGAANVNVVVTEFEGPGAPIGPVELYREHYVPVTPDHISSFPPDPDKAGDWPDGLVPFVDHFTGEDRDGAPFDAPPGYTVGVFGDVYVPEDQAPGDYVATVTVTANGRAEWRGTVRLTVWDFALPNEMNLAGAYGFSGGTMCGWHAARGGVTDCTTLTREYFEEFARHRIGLDFWAWGGPSYAWNDDAGTFDWDWTWFDEMHGPYLDGTFYTDGFRFNTMALPGAPGGRPGNVDPAVWEREYWAGWAAHFREKGWNDVLFYYLPDEPRPEQYPALRDLAARLHAADPDLQPLVTEQFEEGLAGDVDIWCPDEPLFSDSRLGPPFPEDYDDRRALGEKTWWYNCVSAVLWFDYANHFVDYDSSYQRIWTWLTRRYEFQGLLFWHTVYLPALGLDPWESEYAPPFAQGDGNLIYPGTIDRIGGVADIPVASLRMKYIRESMEDYEYFHLLDQRGDGDWVDGVVRTVAPKTYQWEHDGATLLEWRDRVAAKILGTLDETPPAPPTDLSAVGETDSIRLVWTPPADADLAGYDVWYGLYENDAYFGGSVGAGAHGALLTGLAAGREYRAWVRSFDAMGNRSEASETVTATPTGDAGGGEPDRNAVRATSSGEDGDPGQDETGGCG
jgi:hypothetical protein